jgi:hypothetical protein
MKYIKGDEQKLQDKLSVIQDFKNKTEAEQKV